jgi:hypothetical protein
MGGWSAAREALTCAFIADREMDRKTLIYRCIRFVLAPIGECTMDSPVANVHAILMAMFA